MIETNIPWGAIGEIVYTRTYSRYIPELKRREYWHETVDRVIAYSRALAPAHVTEEELKAFRNYMLALKAFPAGRTLWIGGSPFASEFPQANFNCAFIDIRSSRDFHDIVYLLMSGTGVGFRATQDNIDILNKELPLIQFPKLTLKPYQFIGKASQLENTIYRIEDNKIYITVGDSRDGWSQLPKLYLEVLAGKYGSIDEIVIDFNYVRPLGWRLKRFGGYASGPDVLISFLREAHQVLGEPPHCWTQVKVLDIVDLLGRTVVAGGTRRSALIALGDDEDFARAKTGDWWLNHSWRAQSNNSVILQSRPTVEELAQYLDYAIQYGEPGFINAETASHRRPNFRGVNPCAEILLDSFGFCNLSTVNLTFVKDLAELEHILKILTRHSLRITLVQLPEVLDRWNHVQHRDRLLGVSMTGIMDFMFSRGKDLAYMSELFRWARAIVNKEAKSYAAELGVNPPLLSTTIKPEGTISQLPGVSSGIHPAFAPYYVRRIRINAVDAIAKSLRMAGYEPKPEYDPSNPNKPLEESNVWVFEFPVSAPTVRPAKDWSAIEMLELYKLAMTHWADHNVSITVYLSPEEKPQVAQWLYDNWDHYVAISFFPKDSTPYPLMPYEEIDALTYHQLVSRQPKESFRKYLDAIESDSGYTSAEELEDPSCATGACPVR